MKTTRQLCCIVICSILDLIMRHIIMKLIKGDVEMSMHEIPLNDVEREGLVAHHLQIGKPSQLSDAFRLGVAWSENHKDTEIKNN